MLELERRYEGNFLAKLCLVLSFIFCEGCHDGITMMSSPWLEHLHQQIEGLESEDYFSFANGRFSGSMLIFRGVYQHRGWWNHRKCDFCIIMRPCFYRQPLPWIFQATLSGPEEIGPDFRLVETWLHKFWNRSWSGWQCWNESPIKSIGFPLNPTRSARLMMVDGLGFQDLEDIGEPVFFGGKRMWCFMRESCILGFLHGKRRTEQCRMKIHVDIYQHTCLNISYNNNLYTNIFTHNYTHVYIIAHANLQLFQVQQETLAFPS